MTRRGHLYLVPKALPAKMRAEPPPLCTRRLPPMKPKRPAAAVRKSLRVALAAAATLETQVRVADSRYPRDAQRAVQALQGYAYRLTTLTEELALAIKREGNYHLWRVGKPYVE